MEDLMMSLYKAGKKDLEKFLNEGVAPELDEIRTARDISPIGHRGQDCPVL